MLIRAAMILLLLAATEVRAQQVTFSNNLLYDTWLTPNLRMGVRLAPHWSVGVNGGYRPWPTDDMKTRKWKHLLVSPDVRYWTDSVNVHHFFGINLIYSHYNISNVKFPFGMWKSLRHERREGDLGAIGAYYGYSWPIARHWNIEAHIGAALAYTRYDKFECGHCGRKLGEKKKLFVLPQAGLSIVYNLPGRPKKVEQQPTVLTADIQPEPVIPTAAVVVVEPFIPVVHPVVDFTGTAGVLQKTNPVVTHVSEYKPYDRTRILRKEKDALFVHYALGRSMLNPDYRDNRQTLDRIVDITRQIVADSVSSVKKIQIIGLASIEGKSVVNERLATNRALALQRYIQQNVNVADSLFDTVGGGEAWADFRDIMQEMAANDQQSDQLKKVVEIIDQNQNMRQREWLIKQLDGGRTWQRLQKEVLAEQRNAGYIRIYYDYAPDQAAATINEASELLGKGRYQEVLQKLQTVSNDERAQNALGVALWQTGKKVEALRAFRRAAATGNKDAQENLKQLEGRM